MSNGYGFSRMTNKELDAFIAQGRRDIRRAFIGRCIACVFCIGFALVAAAPFIALSLKG